MLIENQIRYSSGKPRLSYFWANDTALGRANEAWMAGSMPANVTVDVVYASIYGHITGFLALGPYGSYVPLAEALFELVTLLEDEVAGAVVECNCDEGVVEFLNSAVGALDAYCAVCAYGETKYSRGNYRLGAPVTEYLDSALRHLRSARNGQRIDDESGCLHLALAVWNIWQALDQPSFRDDRLREVQTAPWEDVQIPELVYAE